LAHGLTNLHGGLSSVVNGLLDIFNVRYLKVLVLDLVELVKSLLDLFSNVSRNLASELFKLTLCGLIDAMGLILEVNKLSSLLVFLLELLGLLQHALNIILGETS
jgi:hypothetical protein